MNEEVIHIYFLPGMAANVSIFEFIKLPDYYKTHTIPWEIPRKNESMKSYAKRFSEYVKEPNSVLLGVSFGGIIAQEMSEFLSLRKLIIVSSVKTKLEFPTRFEIVRRARLYKIMPTSLIGKVKKWEDISVTEQLKKVGRLYDKYLTLKDKDYLDWSIENILNWEQMNVIPGIIHIHGDKDLVFPVKNIKNCIRVSGGTHSMIINRARWFNENLPELIEY